jgi:hypothetical protein
MLGMLRLVATTHAYQRVRILDHLIPSCGDKHIVYPRG